MIVNWLTPRENGQPILRERKTPEIVARTRLCAVVQALRGQTTVGQDNSFGFFLGHLDATVIRVVHVNEGDELCRGIHDGDVFKNTYTMSV